MDLMVCALVVMVGFKDPLSHNEKLSLKRAHRGCAQYFPEAPCLTKFEKRADQTYWATCGAPKRASKVYPKVFVAKKGKK